MNLSAIRSVIRAGPRPAGCIFLLLVTSAWGQGGACAPPPEIQVQLGKATAVVNRPGDFDQGLAPLVALRKRYPRDLWVNEQYQDAVQQYGIEGHLRKLTEEYQVLATQHPDEVIDGYLYARSLMGRSTPSAFQQMAELVAAHPDFAPAHRALAQIYASAMFRDEAKEKTERQLFLTLCPGASVPQRPAALPEPSLLVDQAERLLAQGGDPARVEVMAVQGIQEDEWRLQRIRAFDWYSVEYKRQVQRDLQSKYWKLWAVQVRCYRRAGQQKKASDLLAVMEQRAASLRRDSGPVYWEALITLAHLHEEGNEKELETQNLDSMREFLAAHPDPNRSAQLQDLSRQLENTTR